MEDFYTLRNKYAGKPIAVLGGGSSLKNDVKKLPKGCIKIAANHHATERRIPVQYIFFQDLPVNEKIQNKGRAKTITTFSIGDYKLEHLPRRLPYSGMVAAWIASIMTDKDIILCGMDCYVELERFPHKRHINEWAAILNEKSKIPITNPSRIYAMSGVLSLLVFKKWENQ
jgi:hypothetical protein